MGDKLTNARVVAFNSEEESIFNFIQRFLVQNCQSLKAIINDTQKASLLCRALPVILLAIFNIV